MNPHSSAVEASIGRPVRPSAAARWRPIRRRRLAVPPARGINPNRDLRQTELRTGSAIIPVGVYQLPGGRHHAVVRPPVDVERRGRLREDVARATEDLALELELLIRAQPEQWHLMYPNWPSDEVALEAFRAQRAAS